MSDQPIYDKTAQGFSSVRVPSLPAVPVPHTEEDDKAAEEYAIRVLPDHLEHRFHPSVRKPFADAFLAGAQAGALRERDNKEGIIAERDAKSNALAADIIGKAQAIESKLAEKDAEIALLKGEIDVHLENSAGKWELIAHLRSDLAIAREALRRAGEAMPDWDCGSNSCRFAKIKGGMRTNGGCTCLEEIRNAPKARMAFARIASVLSTLTTKESK